MNRAVRDAGTTTRADPHAQPVVVRLPNWIGDVVMALPALQYLQDHGHAPTLIGKRWAQPLLRACGWSVETLASTRTARIRQWRAHRGARGLLLTNSFSSAFESRLGGIQCTGFRQDGRSLLLHQGLTLPPSSLPSSSSSSSPSSTRTWHESDRFLLLAQRMCAHDARTAATPTALPRLPIDSDARTCIQAWLRQRGLDSSRDTTASTVEKPPPRYAVLVPFATGQAKHNGVRVDKRWPHFPELARALAAHMPVVIAPAPGEESVQARRDFPQAHIADGIGLDDYAALLADAALVVANDTGPGHIAAAVGAPLLSLFGPSDPDRYGPRGPRVTILHEPTWPTCAQVLEQSLARASVAA